MRVIKELLTKLKRRFQKKKNDAMWGSIELSIATAIEDVAFYSKSVIPPETLEREIDPLISDVMEYLIPKMEEMGGVYPTD